MTYPVSVACPRWDRRRKKLKKYGLRWNGKSWTGDISGGMYAKLRSYCSAARLKYRIDNGFGERSQSYRETFYKTNPPHFLGRWWFCAYCGRLLSRKTLTVDHLWPVDAAQKDPAVQAKLRRMGCRDVNDHKNLVAACMQCNVKKGAHTGRWTWKGRIGRHPLVWKFVHLARFAVITAFAVWFFTSGTVDEIMSAAENIWMQF